MTDTDMIKALRCLASQDAEGNCCENIYNSMNRDKQEMRCGGYTDGSIPCPYYQNKYEVCFQDGECGEWLNAVADVLEKLNGKYLKKQTSIQGKRESSTTNKDVSEMSMIELAYNSCYAKDGKARYRDYDQDIDARELAIKLMDKFADIPNEFTCDEDFDDFILDATQYGTDSILGLIAVFYRNLWAMADLRESLKCYEDTGLTPEEITDGKLLTGWIPVGERLPDEPEYFDLDEMELYIVMVEGAEKPAALYYAGEGDWMDENEEFYSVLAWMPLPEPYKPEEEICGK